MGKGDLSSPHSVASTDEANGRGIRSRHLSNGLTAPIDAIAFSNRNSISNNSDGHMNGIKHRITNGFQSICSNHLYYESSKCIRKREKDKEMPSKCRGYAALAIMLFANLLNYMDRYTIAGK